MINNKKRPTIAIDIDDVLAKSAGKIIEYGNQKWGSSLTVQDYDEDFSRIWQVDHEEVKRRFDEYIEFGMFSTYEHDSDAMFVLEKLKNDYDLIIITSRNSKLKKDTIAWLNSKFPGIFDETNIYFAGFWDAVSDGSAVHRTKGEFVKIFNADYLIDDQLKHCLSVSELGIESVLFGNYSWNKADFLPHNVSRASNWMDVLRYFDERK